MYRLGPCIPSFSFFFLLIVQKGCVYVIMLKIVLALFKNLCFDVKKWCKRIIALDSCKTYCCDLEKIVMSDATEHMEICSTTTMTIYFHYCNSYNYQNKQGGELV